MVCQNPKKIQWVRQGMKKMKEQVCIEYKRFYIPDALVDELKEKTGIQNFSEFCRNAVRERLAKRGVPQ